MYRRSRFLEPDEVKQFYVVEGHSRKETAQHFNVPEWKIKNIITRHKLKKTKHICNFSYEEFYTEYIIKNKTCSEIAKEFGFTKEQILGIKRKYKIVKSIDLHKQAMSRISSSPEFMQSVKQTNIEKYGVPYVAQSHKIMEKRAENNLQKYGVKNIMQLSSNVQKQQITNLQRYGSTTPMADPKVLDKRRQTVQQKYGVDNVFQSHEIKRKAARKYVYDKEQFDSSWELALWIYAKDHGEPIEREPLKMSFVYKNRIHYYFPDFRYNGRLIEVKGEHLLRPNFFNDVYNNKERDALYQAKYQHMKDNDILIFSQNEIQPYLDYIVQTYGKRYLQKFRKRLDNDDTDCKIDIDF